MGYRLTQKAIDSVTNYMVKRSSKYTIEEFSAIFPDSTSQCTIEDLKKQIKKILPKSSLKRQKNNIVELLDYYKVMERVKERRIKINRINESFAPFMKYEYGDKNAPTAVYSLHSHSGGLFPTWSSVNIAIDEEYYK